jgi:tetratricopeptide (TPR) repeat protein
VPVNEIRRIAFANDPPELRRARDDVLEGQLENGLEALKRINAASIERAVVQRDLQYYLAYCQAKIALAGGGDKAAAATALLAFARDDPKSYHFYEAAELLGDLALALESFENASKYYAAIGRAPWPDFQLRAEILEARVLLAQGKYSDGLQVYEKTLSARLDSPDVSRQKLLASAGKALCLAELGKADEGIQVLEAMIDKHDPQDVVLFGRIYNALGRCHYNAKRPKDALLAYLHVHLLFASDPDPHAESLYFLSKLWAAPEINKPEEAVAARNTLLKRYSGSPWSKRN